MSIVRGQRPEANWYALDKRISEDERLSWAARGLLVFLLGKPDHWRISIEHLRAQTEGARVKTGRDGIYALLAELQTAGYLTTSRSRGADGTLGPVDYIVRERPQSSATVQPLPAQAEVVELPGITPLPAQPLPAEPYPAEPTLVKTERAAKTDSSKRASEPKGSGDEPPADPIWHTGLSFLVRKGIPEKQARSFLGKLKAATGDITAAALLAQAETDDITDPVPWLSAHARQQGATHANAAPRRRVGLADRHPRPSTDDDYIAGSAIRVHA